MKNQTSNKEVKIYQIFSFITIFVAIISLIFLKPEKTHAEIYPNDAVTIQYRTATAGTYTLLNATTTPQTIISLSIFDTSTSNQILRVGGANFFEKNNATPITVNTNYVYTNGVIDLVKTGTSVTNVFVTYLPYDLRARSIPVFITNPTTATSTITVDTSELANFQEVLFIACVIIFFLAILAWPTFFRMFRRQEPI